jgi:hypothetical protein
MSSSFCRNLIQLMCLAEALKLNITQDKVRHLLFIYFILYLFRFDALANGHHQHQKIKKGLLKVVISS